MELLISLGESQRRAGEPAYRTTLFDAARLAHRRGDAPAMARAVLAQQRGVLFSSGGVTDWEQVEIIEAALDAVAEGDSPERARLLANLALELFLEDRERRVRLSDEALGIARRLGDPATLTHVLISRFFSVSAPSTLEERLDHTAELVTLADRLGDPLVASRGHLLRFRVLTGSSVWGTSNAAPWFCSNHEA